MTNLQDKLDKVPDPKLHQVISFVKSGARIVSSIVAIIMASSSLTTALIVLAAGYGLAEIVGVIEELV